MFIFCYNITALTNSFRARRAARSREESEERKIDADIDELLAIPRQSEKTVVPPDSDDDEEDEDEVQDLVLRDEDDD